MKTKVNSTIVIAGVFLFMILVLYAMKKKGEGMAKLVAPAPAGVQMGKYPDWRILPYDPYKIGKGKKYDPHTLRMSIAPLSPSSWSSSYPYDNYDMAPAGR